MKRYYNVHTIWLAMIVLTLSTYAIGKFEYNGLIAAVLVLLTALIKGIFIIRDFMELKDVSLAWRFIMYGWLWGVCIAIIVAYWIGF